jgi:hypothetical protein
MQQETVKPGKNKAPPVETKAVVAQAPTAVALSEEFKDGAWDLEMIDSKDIIIPKILLMHPTSDLVKKGVRNQGDIIKSTSGEVVAKRGESFEVIVFDKWKEWRIMKKDVKSGRFEFSHIEAWTPENDNLQWDYVEGGMAYRRDKTLSFYALLASEIGEGKSPFPVRLSFTRTGFKSGGKIADAYARALMERQPPTRQKFKIGAELVNGKEETYFAFTVEHGEATSSDQQKAATEWRKTVLTAKKSNSVRDHEADEEKTVDAAASATESF